MKKLFPLLLLLAGCGVDDEHPGPITFKETNREVDCLLVFAIDPSPRFRNKLAQESGLFNFWTGTVLNYKRELQGAKKDLIICAASGDNVTWFHGTPKEFHEEYDSPERFQQLLNRPHGSVGCYEGLADTIDYILRINGVQEKQFPVYVVVMSSMVDNSSPEELIDVLKRYRQVGGRLAWYWPERSTLPKIDAIREAAGYPKVRWEDCNNPPPMHFD